MSTPQKRTLVTKRGRPSAYTPELAAAICDRLADGESLRSVCNNPAMPSRTTVLNWLDRNEDFRRQYGLAKWAMEELYFDRVLEVADDDSLPVERRRLMIDVLKWHLSKLAPKKYGRRPEEPVEKWRIRVTIAGEDFTPRGHYAIP